MLNPNNYEEFDFYVVPKRAEFSTEKGGAARHLMVNGTNKSNNNLYKVSPVYTVLSPGCAKRLQILREPGDAQIDKLIFLYKNTRLRNAREAFQADSGISRSTEPEEVVKRVLLALISKPPPPPTLSSNFSENTEPLNTSNIAQEIPFMEE